MSLWAITSLFHPARFRSRGDNYRVFRAHLQMPLLAVELVFDADADFTVQTGDADIVIHLRGGARLWQKERLLNVALAALPADCDAVIAIDADLIIDDPAWPAAVQRALEIWPVVQPYSVVHHLDPDGHRIAQATGTVAAWSGADGRLALPPDAHTQMWPGNGHIWAARRELLARHGFYDRCIVGGGDTAFIGAATGCVEIAIRKHVMGPAQERCYRAWAAPFAAEVGGQVGYVPAEALHLWHGTHEARRWSERHRMLRELAFDADADIRVDAATGVWHWASDRPDLHEQVHGYLKGRREDDAPTAASTAWSRALLAAPQDG